MLMAFVTIEPLISMLHQFSANRVVLGLSGGLDSMVLLELLYQARQQHEFELEAVYINHGFSANADSWGSFCQQQCYDRQIKFEQISLQLDKGPNLEARARKARYQALAGFIKGKHDLLMTAHHADDQLETLLLALKRGAGPAGLRGIAAEKPFSAGWLLRPLLDYSRQQLEQVAAEWKLQWIEDESNSDEQFDRNFIRRQISPLLQARWPGMAKTVSRSMQHIAAEHQILNEYLNQELALCCTEEYLCLSALLQYPAVKQDLIIRRWLAVVDLNPSSVWLGTLRNEVIAAKADATPLLQLEHFHIRRFDGKLYLCEIFTVPEINEKRIWQGEGQLALPADSGQLIFSKQQQDGSLPLALAEPAVAEVHFGKLSLPFKPVNSGMHKPLKQWFKQWKIPPWQRGAIPLLLICGELRLVAGYASTVAPAEADIWVKWLKKASASKTSA